MTGAILFSAILFFIVIKLMGLIKYPNLYHENIVMNPSEVNFFKRENAPSLAYVHIEANKNAEISQPAVMFLGGYRSDMEGTKALYLQEKCKKNGQAFIRFDYQGHGRSEGDFEEGTIGKWKEDALFVLDQLVEDKVILVGSSMGGWISLLIGKERPEKVAGIVGIAAAPDFTRDIEGSMTSEQAIKMQENGYIEVPNDYSDEPYIFTKSLIVDGEQHSLLDKEYQCSFPVRLIQGMRDEDVEWQKAFRFKNAANDCDVEVLLIEDGDHRLSREEDLIAIEKQVSLLSAY
jgi:pimeloyl-ACP methyl ester carboxylesterase